MHKHEPYAVEVFDRSGKATRTVARATFVPFAVTEPLELDAKDGTRWVITQVPSGCAVWRGSNFRTAVKLTAELSAQPEWADLSDADLLFRDRVEWVDPNKKAQFKALFLQARDAKGSTR